MKDKRGRNGIVGMMGGMVLLTVLSTSDQAVALWGSLFTNKMDALIAVLVLIGLTGVLGDLLAGRKKVDLILYAGLALIAYYLFIDKH